MTAFDDLLVINNLGRNIVSATCNGGLEPIACFDETVYPHLDDEQQFDIDMHCFLRWNGRLVAVNHYGLVRFFDWSDLLEKSDGRPRSLAPLSMGRWPGDVERFAIARHSLISTSPMGYAVEDAAQCGLLVSEPLDRLSHIQKQENESSAAQTVEIAYRNYLEDWGTTTALAVHEECARSEAMVAVAAGCRLGVFELTFDGLGATRLGKLLYEGTMPFSVTFLHFASEQVLVAAGFDQEEHQEREQETAQANDQDQSEDWDKLKGGGFAKIELSGENWHWHQFGVDLAFGNGADPLVISSREQHTIYGIDRFANLYAWSIDKGECQVVYSGENDRSLGLAHMTLIEPGEATAARQRRSPASIFCGFNRDGYRLHRYQI